MCVNIFVLPENCLEEAVVVSLFKKPYSHLFICVLCTILKPNAMAKK